MSAVQTTTTVATTTSNRTGIQLTVTPQSNTQTIGNFVTDVSASPYIQPQIISFVAKGMRPNQRVHAFFDSVLVDNWCAPGTYNGGPTSNWQSVTKTGNFGDPLVTDANGVVAGQFNVNQKTTSGVTVPQFKVGDRVFELADVTSLALGNNAITTQSMASFTSSNLSVTKQPVTLTTVNPTIGVMNVSNTVVGVNTTVSNTYLADIANITSNYYDVWSPPPEPVAQALTINTPTNEAGIFATSIVLYFGQVAQVLTHGVTVYICETIGGYPNGNSILPFSTVHLDIGSINVSSDASVGTTFTFEAPVFMNNNTTYAVVVKPDAGDPDYRIYTAVLGDTDLLTKRQMFSQPIIGTAFYGSTATEWTALQTEYLKFQLNIANFTQTTGDVYFNNSNTDYLTLNNIGYANTSATINPGDIIYQSTNSTTTTANTSIAGVIHMYNDFKNILYVANSTGNFTPNSYMQIHRFANATVQASPGPNSTTLVAWSNTGSFYQPLVDAFVPQFASIAPAGTKIIYDYKGTSNSYAVDTTTNIVHIGTETEFFDKERILVGKSKEVSSMSGAKSTTVHAQFTTDSTLLSPMIDTVKTHGQVIGNLIDPVSNVYNEYFTNGGSKSKYISQIITLASGQDAQDLQITLTAHRPPGTDIKIYAKFLNSQDSEPIGLKTWTPMLNLAYNLYSDPSNPDDVSSFTYSTYPYYPLLLSNGTSTSANSSNVVTGTSTQFGQTGDIQVGMWVNMKANSTFGETCRQVTSISSNTSLTLNLPFNGNYTTNSIYIVSPPTTAYQSGNSVIQIPGYVTISTTNNAVTGLSSNVTANTTGVVTNALVIASANTYYAPGQKIYYSVPASNTAIPGLTGNTYYYIATSNTTTITLNSQPANTTPITLTPISGAGEYHSIVSTNFNSLLPGQILSVNGYNQAIVSISNNSYLTVGAPWTAAYTNANASISTKSGLTYLNNNNNLYTTFKQFQIKVILQSNDSSKIPTINDLSALALQL